MYRTSTVTKFKFSKKIRDIGVRFGLVVNVFTNTLTALGSSPRHGTRTEGLERGSNLKKSVPSASLPERMRPVGGSGGLQPSGECENFVGLGIKPSESKNGIHRLHRLHPAIF